MSHDRGSSFRITETWLRAQGTTRNAWPARQLRVLAHKEIAS